jgi:cold shock CspA family protein
MSLSTSQPWSGRGLRELREGQAVSFDLERDSRSGKLAASNLQVKD